MDLSRARAIMLLSIKEHIPLMLWGPPGIGKSDLAQQVAEELKYNLNDMRLAQMEPTELRGFLSPNRETHRAEWYQLGDLPERGPDGKGVKGPGILFLDEIDKAPTSVKSAALQLVLNRRVGPYQLPDDWDIICAGNREEDGCFAIPVGQALNNRMTHIEIQPDIEVWTNWAHNHGVRMEVIGYLNFQPNHLYDNNGQHAFPTPRSWTMASRLLGHTEDEDLQKSLVASAVGEGIALQFVSWKKVYSKVDPKDVIEKGIIPTFKKDEISLKYAVTMAVAFHVRNKSVKKYMNNIAKYMDSIPADMKVVFIRQLKPQTLAEFALHPAFESVIKATMGSLSL